MNGIIHNNKLLSIFPSKNYSQRKKHLDNMEKMT